MQLHFLHLVFTVFELKFSFKINYQFLKINMDTCNLGKYYFKALLKEER